MKENIDGIKFNEEKHRYTNKDGVIYTSGTSFIGKFKQPFEKEFWSTFKVYEPYFDAVTLSGELLDEFNSYRRQAGWRQVQEASLWKLVKARKMVHDNSDELLEQCKSLCLQFDIKVNLKADKERILEEWKVKNKQSTDKGTAYHNEQEDKLRKETNFHYDWDMKDISDLKAGTYPEMRLYNHQYQLAGTADVVKIYHNKNIIVRDHKTNAKLDFDSFTNPYTKKKQMMKFPCDGLPDCNVSHYTLQLSLYGWMLEQFGYKVNALFIDYAEEKNGKWYNTPYEMPYMKSTIERMIEHFNSNK